MKLPRYLSKRERSKLVNRSAILDAALACFLDLGFEAVTIRDVIRRTKLASGTFYNYFPDKPSLFRALVEARLGELQEQMHQVRERAVDVRSFFYESFLVPFQAVRDDPTFFELMFRNEPVVRSFYHDNVFGLILQTLKDDLHNAVARGVIPAELDLEAMTAVSFGAGYELARLLSQQPERTPEAAAQFVTRLFLEGIGSLVDQPRLIRLGSRMLRGAAR
ncbi:TetR/AcrR family transcriptional regulator [Sinimarinibacterium sp. NLF-5-8]|uniref:TetR/AcrR family transcriptional regulator n=1 Tax=Sinimarinibacterium sp. NLF-5-8 TaxID=2698684 RepID=UPI00137C20B2|nr:TetR/AcrR family transcriptional regulator [Sinimarinibacterium sp. NLF-5-8]QHS08726.1 TetR/AcrR family transcriptional regulator [Sinimarinibacterium sp. NLF-5-8]